MDKEEFERKWKRNIRSRTIDEIKDFVSDSFDQINYLSEKSYQHLDKNEAIEVNIKLDKIENAIIKLNLYIDSIAEYRIEDR